MGQVDSEPYITLSPDTGVPGTPVSVRGGNFTAGAWVDVYYYVDATQRIPVAEVKADYDGDFRVKFEVPESCKGRHKVRAEVNATFYAEQEFTVVPGLTISPVEGSVATNVTVEGHGFGEKEKNIELLFYLDGNYTAVVRNITADEDGWWRRSFQVPSSARGSHKIDARGSVSKLGDVQDASFRVMPSINLDKPSGSPGEAINMTGYGFAANDRYIKIIFAGAEAQTDPAVIRADDKGYWQGSFLVPEKPRGTYNVTAQGESTSEREVPPLTFNITAGLRLSPAEGHVGMDLTVIGRGFATNKDVVIKYEDVVQASTTTDGKGGFEVTFTVPESQHGARLVTARDAAGNNASTTFTMESGPPGMPELISPSNGTRVSFLGRAKPTLNWSEVFDLSGVRYNLQIGTSANVTADGFSNTTRVFSKQSWEATNYTLETALGFGTYYWIVQAVDRAGNAGNWSEPISFRVGVMPLWAFILCIVAAAAGIATLVYFFVIRRRLYYY